MKFEGHQVNIPIKGIMRAGTDNLAADGAMNEVVGMEYKDGSWLPYKEKEERWHAAYIQMVGPTGTLEHLTFKDVFTHKTSDGQEHYVFIADSHNNQVEGGVPNIQENDVLYETSRSTTTSEGNRVNVSLLTHDAQDISFVSNMLCVATSTNIEYYLWKDGSYKNQTPDVSSLPVVQLRVDKGIANSDAPEGGYVGMKSHSCSKLQTVGTTGAFCDAYEQAIHPILTSKQVGSGLLTKAKGMQTENGGLTGYLLACVAYRMKNGEYVAASAPVLLAPPDVRHADIEEAAGYVSMNDIDFHGAKTTWDHLSGYIDCFVHPGSPLGEDDQTLVTFNPDGWPVGSERPWNDEKTGVLPIYRDTAQGIEDEFDRIKGDLAHTASKESEEYYQEEDNMSLFWTGGHPINPHDDFTTLQPPFDGLNGVNYNDFTRGTIDGVPNCNIVRPLPLMASIGINYNSSTDEVWLNQVVSGISNKLQFRLKSSTMNADLYDGIGIFISQEIEAFRDMTRENFVDMHGEFRYGLLTSNSSTSTDRYWAACAYTPQYRKAKAIREDIRKTKSMYLVKFLDLEDMKNTAVDTWVDVDLKGLLGDTLVTLPSITMNALMQATKLTGGLSTYNSRLHVYDYKANYGVDTKLDCQLYHGGTGQYSAPEIQQYSWSGNLASKLFIGYVVKNDIGNGNIIEQLFTWVKADESGLILADIPLTSTPILAFKGNNIQSIEMFVKMEYGSYQDPHLYTSYWYKNMPFEKNSDLGIAYILGSELMPFIFPDVTPNKLTPSGPWSHTKPTGWRDNLDNNYVEKDEYISRNGLKVSDVAYPMYFPTEFSYRVGNEKIIGLARLTTPVSQDNFGNNQLIVFCKDGIYAMTVDTSGNGAYTSIPPMVSPEVCVNKNSICEIGGAIFFAADKGLMMLTGANQVQQYVPQLNGEPRFLPAATQNKEARGVYKTMVESTQILSQSSLDSFSDAISKEDFVNFIKDERTHLVYISIKNKLLAYNTGYDTFNHALYDFSYLIDIPTGNTTKLEMRAECDDKDLIGKTIWEKQRGTTVYDVHTFEYLSQDNNQISCLVQSRPIKVQQDDKCSYRVVLTGYFEGLTGNWADLVVMGSLDGDNWRVIGVKEKKLYGGFHNLGCLTERGSWKYLMFIFGGKLSNNSHIDSVDITVDGRYNNKKR